MDTYNSSRVLSIRLSAELLDAVREQARIDGRSLSGEIVSIVKEQVAARSVRRSKPLKITGWLAQLEVPETHAEFRAGRAAASAEVERGLRRRWQARARK